MIKLVKGLLGVLLLGLVVSNARAGGSGLNVVVVVNANSTNSLQLGNYFRQARNVPPQNFLRINWPTNSVTLWSGTDYTNTLLGPLLTFLTQRHLTNQIDYIVLSMDIPYRVGDPTNYYDGTTSALFYGFKSDPGANGGSSCDLATTSTNLYAGSESIFRSTPPTTATTNTWLVTMLTANDLSTAKMTVDQGVAGDSTFPTNTVWLAKSVETDRNVRYTEFDNTVFSTRLRGNYTVLRTNRFSPQFDNVILGYQNGVDGFTVYPPILFVPGAMADNLTSFSGALFDSGAQTSLLAFIDGGASGSYGTVSEPCNYLEKFPDSQNYFYQSRGFSLAECYYQSVTNPYEGVIVGEPLSAPFAQPGSGSWSGLVSNSVLSGTTNLFVQFTAADASHPLQQLDLFLDGVFLQTVTNISPQSGNILDLSLNGFATSYTVPIGATIKSITSNLVVALNNTTYQNNTKVAATARGDRIELQSTAAYTKTGAQISLAASSTNSSGSLTTFLRSSPTNPTNFLDSVAQGIKGYEIVGTLLANSTMTLTVTKTNNTIVTVAITNNSDGSLTAFAQQFINAINANTNLQGLDGLNGADLVTDPTTGDALFNLQANGQGYAAAQIKAAVSTSLGVVVQPTGSAALIDNVTDLRPRNHLYITAGVTSLSSTIPFNTTGLADGYHQLTAVAYEGSHVRTQTRASQNIIVQNTALSATFTPTLTGTNTALQPTLQFAVVANANNITNIQLYSTGGPLSSVSNQSSTTFTVNPATLDIGIHPFYAVVTDNAGHQYQTASYNVGFTGVSYSGTNLFGIDYPFALQLTGTAPTFTFPATAGRTYNVLTTPNLAQPFTLHTTVTPTSSLGQYTESSPSSAQQFYRLSVTP